MISQNEVNSTQQLIKFKSKRMNASDSPLGERARGPYSGERDISVLVAPIRNVMRVSDRDGLERLRIGPLEGG